MKIIIIIPSPGPGSFPRCDGWDRVAAARGQFLRRRASRSPRQNNNEDNNEEND